MIAIRPSSRRFAQLMLGAGVVLSVGAVAVSGRTVPGASASVLASTFPDTLAFNVEYAGLGAEGVDYIWRGYARGAVPAQVTIRMEYVGLRDERPMPIWPVNVWLFYSADDYRSSFAAEMSGSLNWHTGELLVSGLVSDGIRVNVPLEQRVRLHRPGLAGAVTVVFLPRVALGDELAAAF